MKVVAISSLAAVGNAGLKSMISVLGSEIIPVPSLVLSGLGNIAGHQKFKVPLAELLHSTLAICQANSEQVIIYVGYLADKMHPAQIGSIIEKFQSIIKSIVVDPVCGDQGLRYVDTELVGNWKILVPKADFLLPNHTELFLLTGSRPDLNNPEKTDIAAQALFSINPHTTLIVTGLKTNPRSIQNVIYLKGLRKAEIICNYYPRQLSGTGDAFAALFMKYHLLLHYDLRESIDFSARIVACQVAYTIAQDSEELQINPDYLSLL